MSSFSQFQPQSRRDLLMSYLAIFILILFEHAPLGNYWLTAMDIGIFFVPIFFLARVYDGPWGLFGIMLLGLAKDLTSETPLGFWVLLFCLFFMLSSSQRQFLVNAGFRTVWSTFVFICLLTYSAYYLISLVHNDLPESLLLTVISAVATMISFPLVYLPFAWMQGDEIGFRRR